MRRPTYEEKEAFMTKPKPLHAATISYRTPAGRRVLFGGIIASGTLARCK